MKNAAGGGYQGKYLEINLNNYKATEIELPRRYMEDFIGGAGINMRLAYDYAAPGDGAFSPGNPLIFGVGPFVGTFIPGSSKGNVTFRSPINNLIGTSGSGQFGKLKFAGYDNLVITGRADRPVYLKITEKGAEFCDASHLWGKDVWEATDAIWDETGPNFTVAAIGPAGENLVKFASIIIDKFAAFARCGLGAVMGYKNLKAIAVYGGSSVSVADPGRFTKLMDKLWSDFNSYPLLGDWRKFGTVMSMESMAKQGLYGAKNYRADFGLQLLDDFSLNDLAERVKIKDVACLSCPVGCKHHLRLPGTAAEGREISVSCLNATLTSLGTFTGLTGWDTILSLAEQTTRMGMDLYDMGSLITMVFELYEKGLLDRQTADNLDLAWGNEDTVRKLILKTARREGFGGILAEGLLEAPKLIGKDAQEYSMNVKGIGIIHDPRVRPDSTELFSMITNIRGTASNVSITMSKRTPDQIKRFCQRAGVPGERIDKILDYPEGYNVGRLTKWVEDMTSALDCLGTCYFPFYQRISLSDWAQIYSALTGIDADDKSILSSMQKVWDVKKVLSEREGWTKAEDCLPKRFMTESVSVDGEVFPAFTRDQIDSLAGDYYEERGWDRLTGTVTPDRKKELGLACL